MFQDNSARQRRSLVLAAVSLAALICLADDAPASPPVRLGEPFLVTQLPVDRGAESKAATCGGMLRASCEDGAGIALVNLDGPPRSDYGEGGRLVIVDPDGSKRRLAESFHSVCDPAVSFDGKRLLMAGKKSAHDNWNVYEVGVDGSGLRQITQGLGDCRRPAYQSRFYQISEANVAWYHVTFVGRPAGAINETGVGTAKALYSCKLDGSGVRRLTFNLSSDYDPHLLRDGRLVYASWQRRTLERGLAGRVILLEANLEGTDPAPLCVDGGGPIKHMACETSGGLVVFVEADGTTGDGAGRLACVSNRRPLHTYRPITKPEDGLFHSPAPLPDGTILVSRRPADGSGTYVICRLDPASQRVETVLDDPTCHAIQAQLVAPRAEPDGRSSPAIDSDPNGKIYCLNVYTNDFRDKAWLPPGTVKTLRLLEGISRSPTSPTGTAAPPGAPALAGRRILGEVPVAPDGSFNVEVPANTPIELQLVDASGLALRSCGWISTRNHFNQGCVGCHEDPELTPENLMVDALRGPSVVVAPPVEQRRSSDFRRDLMPIVTQKCLPCHAQGGSPPDLTARTKDVADAAFARAVYELLLEPSAGVPSGEPRGRYVDPGRARTSPFIWHLLARNASRPWDGATAQRNPKPIPPDAKQPLKPEETRLFVEWIDLGAAWSDMAPR
jgi:hypothetical protein